MKSKRYLAIIFAIGVVVPLGVLLGNIIEKRFTNEQVKTMNEDGTKKLKKKNVLSSTKAQKPPLVGNSTIILKKEPTPAKDAYRE